MGGLSGLWQMQFLRYQVKFNRFQEHGHSSVEIRNISEPYVANEEYVDQVVNTYGKQEKAISV